jgi:hypothetical protein
VRARALRAPVFLISLPPQTGAARPAPHPSQLRCFLFIPQKQNDSLQARIRAARGVYLSTGTAPLKYNVPLPRPQPCSAHCSFACSICRIIYRKDPAKNHSMGPSVISHWTTEAKKYKVSCYRSCAGTSKDKNDI